jgi:hypothetical protein
MKTYNLPSKESNMHLFPVLSLNAIVSISLIFPLAGYAAPAWQMTRLKGNILSIDAFLGNSHVFLQDVVNHLMKLKSSHNNEFLTSTSLDQELNRVLSLAGIRSLPALLKDDENNPHKKLSQPQARSLTSSSLTCSACRATLVSIILS